MIKIVIGIKLVSNIKYKMSNLEVEKNNCNTKKRAIKLTQYKWFFFINLASALSFNKILKKILQVNKINIGEKEAMLLPLNIGKFIKNLIPNIKNLFIWIRQLKKKYINIIKITINLLIITSIFFFNLQLNVMVYYRSCLLNFFNTTS